MMETLLNRMSEVLEDLTGYVVFEEVDGGMLSFLLNHEINMTLSDINHQVLPTELESYVIRRAVGQFIMMNQSKLLGDESLQVAKSIRMGDTSVELGGTTQAERLGELATVLLNTEVDRRLLSCYRRLRW